MTVEKEKKRVRGYRLKSADDVAKLLARLLNLAYKRELASGCLKDFAAGCNCLLRALERSDLEARIERLERRLEGREISEEHREQD